LHANGHRVTWVRRGDEALHLAAEQTVDLVLLDLGLPDLDGVHVARELRSLQPDCVIVMLTARREEMDVVVGLEAGADDYLTKPFGLTELLARVRAHLRRASSGTPSPAYEFADLRVDVAARRCLVQDSEITLRAKEFDLLARLSADAGRVVSRETLMADVWDEHWFGSTKTLDVHMAALRRRLTEAAEQAEPPAQLPTITTLRGHGYRLELVAVSDGSAPDDGE
jgi:DNA-binding response OmpR family regulator